MMHTPQRRHDRASRHAFTLIEMVMVVLILGILTAVAAPRFASSLTYHRVESAARRLRADLELARELAIASSSDQTVTFSVDSDRYVVSPGPMQLRRQAGSYAVDLAQPPYQAVLMTVDFGGANSVTFSGFGIPDQGGEIVLGVGDRRKRVVLDPVSGKASIK